MPHAIRFHQTGGPEVLKWEEVAVGEPGPNEARIAHKAIELSVHWRSEPVPLELVDEAFARLENAEDTFADWLQGLKEVERAGVIYHPLADDWLVSRRDLDVNYMIAATRPA